MEIVHFTILLTMIRTGVCYSISQLKCCGITGITVSHDHYRSGYGPSLPDGIEGWLEYISPTKGKCNPMEMYSVTPLATRFPIVHIIDPVQCVASTIL
jgi:hypothetical protein